MKKLTLIMLICVALMLCACGKTNNETKVEEPTDNPFDKVSSIYGEFLIPLWNEGFCDLYNYVEQGTNAIGEELDLEYTINKINNLMVKRDEYNNYIQGLNNEYEQIKYIWNKIIEKYDSMYKTIKETTPKPKDTSYKLDYSNVSMYLSDFRNELNKLEE